MNMRNLIPWGRSEASRPATNIPPREEGSPFLTLHREMNRLFDDVFSRFDVGFPDHTPSRFGPSIEAVEKEKEIVVSAELPGMSDKDVEVLIEQDALIIRGEKRSEIEDRERHFSERFYGRFERVIPLPYAVEENQVEASFENGLLRVRIPKTAKALESAKRIPVRTGQRPETQH